MGRELELDSAARAESPDEVENSGFQQLSPDLGYKRLLLVNVVFYGVPGAGDRGWVLIDAGVMGSKGAIVEAAAERFGPGSRPAAIILTHGHFDHVGALEDLAKQWDVPVYAQELELPYLNGTASYPPADPAVGGGLMALISPLYPRGPVDVSSSLRALPPDGTVPEMPGWQWLHTPGHAPGHISLWREADRTLIAGDAVITTRQESAYAVAVQSPELHGPPMYFTPDWQKARSSAEELARLEPELIITGHGRPMHGPQMRAALQLLARDFDKLAVPRQGRYAEHPARAEDGSAYRQPR